MSNREGRVAQGRWRKTGLFGALVLAVVGGCGKRETPVEAARATGTLLIGNGGEPADLDPQTVTGSPESNLVQALFEGLVRYDPVTLDPLPGVAKRWELADDGVTYTFHLRAEAMWSDGRPLTAHDFYGSYQRILAPELGSENAEQLYFLAGGEAYHQGETTDFSTVGCRVIDAHTLELKVARPTVFFVRMLAGRNWFPVPLHVLAQHDALRRQGTSWTREENIVGNGPFVLGTWKRNQYIEVDRSPTYWDREHVALKHVRFFAMENLSTEEAAFRAGQLHKTLNLPVDRIDTYRREHPEQLQVASYSGVYYYSFNVKRPPFDDARVRRALALALNREAITHDVTRGSQGPAPRFLPAGVSGYTSTVPGYTFDPEAARHWLAEAGYPGGAGFPVTTLLYNTADNHRVIAEAAQQMWRRELGIDVRIENQEWKVYLSNMHLGNFDMTRAGYLVAPDDPTRFLEAFSTGHGFNVGQWSDANYDAMLQAALNETEPGARAKIFHAMETRLTEATPVAPIYYYSNVFLLRPEVKNWTNNLLGNYPLREVSLTP